MCAHADLIIAKATSMADECLSKEIPVLFHEYTHNIKNISSDINNYIPQELMFYNFEELYQKSKSFLFSNSSELREKVKELNKTIYFVNKDIKADKCFSNMNKIIIHEVENIDE